MFGQGSSSQGDTYDNSNMNQNRVKVEDALTYLDQVKTQFAEEPAVYTQFLDIMKDFKSQDIDTTEVITRVSRLFHSQPSLITGFNTFLPPGYHVEVQGPRITIIDRNGAVQVVSVEADVETVPAIEPQPMDIAPIVMPPTAAAVVAAAAAAALPLQQQIITAATSHVVVVENGAMKMSSPSPSPDDMNNLDTTPEMLMDQPPPPTNTGASFNHAIGYVNKIKTRFANKPDVYREFLDILHHYQQNLATPNSAQAAASEQRVLDAIAVLFRDDADLLDEFRLFLPEATGFRRQSDFFGASAIATPSETSSSEASSGEESDDDVKPSREELDDQEKQEQRKKSRKRANPMMSDVTRKKSRPLETPTEIWRREGNLKDIISKTSVEDIQYFQTVRRCLDDARYITFLRHINLYSSNILSANELLTMLQPVIGPLPYLMNGLRQMLGIENEVEPKTNGEVTTRAGEQRINSELAHQIDYASCKQLGASYRCLPDSYQRPACSGRTMLCHEVLNDSWVSFPSWSSEDTSSVSSKKTPYEEFIYRTEDERFELDIIIEVNKYAIEALEMTKQRIMKMSTLEQERYRLDERLGASSGSLIQRAIKRIYGEHAAKITEGLRKNPLSAVPKVLDRLIEKEREWREAQSNMNRIWREQNEKHMIRSLDHQANALRVSDAKWLKAKMLIQQIEMLFDERQQRSVDGVCEDVGPHMIMHYPRDRSVLNDANDLIIHYLRRQTNIQGVEKTKIKRILRKYVMEWFATDQEVMSDTEDDDPIPSAEQERPQNGFSHAASEEHDDEDVKIHPELAQTYRLVYGGNSLFVFFRLHQILCDRLGKVKQKHCEDMEDYRIELDINKMQLEIYAKHGKTILSHEHNASDISNGLQLIKSPMLDPTDNYKIVVEEIKNLLDGQIDIQQYEDAIRMLFPTECYLLLTMDKLIPLIARQLQYLALDGDNAMMIKLYEKYRMRKAPLVNHQSDTVLSIESEYAATVEAKLNCQNCFKAFVINDTAPILTIELVDTETGDDMSDQDKADIVDGVVRSVAVMEAARRAAAGSTDGDSDDSDDEDDEKASTAPTNDGASSVGAVKVNGIKSEDDDETDNRPETAEPEMEADETEDGEENDDLPRVRIRSFTRTRAPLRNTVVMAAAVPNATAATSVASSSSGDDPSSEDLEPKYTAPIFLKRNHRKRAPTTVTENFVIINAAEVVVSTSGQRLTIGSSEGIYKKRRKTKDEVEDDLERMHDVRMKRADSLMNREQGEEANEETWLSEGMVRVLTKHPSHPYLVYQRYVSRKRDVSMSAAPSTTGST